MPLPRKICFCLLACLPAACEFTSPAEQALNSLRCARQTIQRVAADRQSARDFTPIQDRITATLTSFSEVAACQCLIAPQFIETQTDNPDHSVTYGQQTRLQFILLITLNSKNTWSSERPNREAAALLRDNGLQNFTLDPARHSGLTWIIQGDAPIPQDYSDINNGIIPEPDPPGKD